MYIYLPFNIPTKYFGAYAVVVGGPEKSFVVVADVVVG